ncbi:MAG: hypothetical protein KCHDKBKB_00277 [Elusimicrobia bacterium]|nr:hypothetical protein [Elusimicrobiota bacterium]
MAILNGILNDSLVHYRRLDKKIRAQLKKLPQGSVYKRHIGKNQYFYLSVREGNEVHSKYLGKEVPIEIEKKIKERRLLERQQREVINSLKLLSKTLKKKAHA